MQGHCATVFSGIRPVWHVDGHERLFAEKPHDTSVVLKKSVPFRKTVISDMRQTDEFEAACYSEIRHDSNLRRALKHCNVTRNRKSISLSQMQRTNANATENKMLLYRVYIG